MLDLAGEIRHATMSRIIAPCIAEPNGADEHSDEPVGTECFSGAVRKEGEADGRQSVGGV
jgi:hypothetical protein